MRVAIASGKGGTGKTTIAAALAMAAADRSLRTVYVDCDVEAPNGHLLLAPTIQEWHTVTRKIPVVNPSLCRRCGRCGNACQFGAIVCAGTSVQVHPTLCRSCGACVAACLRHAIDEITLPVGRVGLGLAGDLQFVHGEMDIGEARPTPIIDAVKAAIDPGVELAILDAPPGMACPAIRTIQNCDRVVLVCEPTAFGLADLRLAVQTVRTMKMPVAVIINRSDLGDDRVDRFCAAAGIPVIARMHHSRPLATACAAGRFLDARALLADVVAMILDRLADARTRSAS